MSILTYRSVDPKDEAVKYVCEHAYATGMYLAKSGLSKTGAETVLCLACVEKMNAGDQELRIDCPISHPIRSVSAVIH
jgi:hypothetical protein